MIKTIADFGLKRVAPVSLIAIACLAGNSWWTYSNITNLVAASAWVERTADIQYRLARIETHIVGAETGQRGYVITGRAEYLEPYYLAVRSTHQRIAELNGLFSDDEEGLAALDRLDATLDAKFGEMENILSIMATGGQVAAGERVTAGEGKVLMDDVRAQIRTMQSTIATELEAQKTDAALARASSLFALLVFVVGTLLLVGLLYLTARREVTRRAQDAAEIEQYATSLKTSMADLQTERNEVHDLNEAAGYLQSCDSVPELSRLLSPILERMFAQFSGEVFLQAPSRNRLDAIAAFGGPEDTRSMSPTDCWALRRGQDHLEIAGDGTPECQHRHVASSPASLCIPLVAHGDAVGLLTLTMKPDAALAETDLRILMERTLRRAHMVGAQLALTLANLKLQDTLRQQAITDPLTGAFNRRYLDAIGDKILAQAGRFGHHLAVAMLDVDHFKHFNDLHGHVAGDHALTAVANFMQSHIREADWLFRYGGEEFLIILHGSDGPAAEAKLNAMRDALSTLAITNGDTVLPSITVSLGCAIYPEQASSLSDLIRQADAALYAAKASGRNRLCMSAPAMLAVA